jgi:hypothetical protein
VEAAAVEQFARYSDARFQTFVPSFVERDVRELLDLPSPHR